VPLLVRWPGKIKPGIVINDIISHEDWMPTLLAAANGGVDTGIQEKLKKGGFKYFDGDGDLNAVRMGEWKITFTDMSGALPTAWKRSPSWPYITNLRRDPYERFYTQDNTHVGSMCSGAARVGCPRLFRAQYATSRSAAVMG